MKDQTTKLHVVREKQPLVASAALLAAGLIRSMAIKSHTLKSRRRELELLQRRPETHLSRSQLYREKSAGSAPTIIVGGFVPDATETAEFQRRILRKYGSIYYLNFPRNGFCSEMFAAQLTDLIDHLGKKRQKPFIMGVSFGGGLLIDFLKDAEEALHKQVRGLILVSPVVCSDDLIRTDGDKRGGVRLLEHNLKKILSADPAVPENIDKLMERSRRCFQALFTGGAENRTLSVRHLSIKKKIFEVISGTSALGGFQRVMALRDFTFPGLNAAVFRGPVLTLLAEQEEDMLVPSSPTLKLFRNTGLYTRLFPKCHVKTVRSGNPEDGVPHASLIFHHEPYNNLIESWYDRQLNPYLQMAV
ncbi:MAG: alpha/beta hydrolase [Desulfuromonadales bacterium]|nr:alpha/beta hydrolase [Desulfuromonadales bacterium]